MQTGLEPASRQFERLTARPLRVLHYIDRPIKEYGATPELGFEPRKAGLEAAVLPLHHSGIGSSGGNRTHTLQVMSLLLHY